MQYVIYGAYQQIGRLCWDPIFNSAKGEQLGEILPVQLWQLEGAGVVVKWPVGHLSKYFIGYWSFIGWLANSCWTPPLPAGWGCTSCSAATRSSCQKGLDEPVRIYLGLGNMKQVFFFQFLFSCFRLVKGDAKSLLFRYSDRVPEELGWMSFISLVDPFSAFIERFECNCLPSGELTCAEEPSGLECIWDLSSFI